MVYKRCPKCKSAVIKCTGAATTGNPAHSFYECLDCHAKFDYKQAEQAGWDFEIIKNKKNMDLGYCPNCGHKDAEYTGGGNPFNQNCAEVKCNHCGHKGLLYEFRDARPSSPKTNEKNSSVKEQEQEQTISEKIAYEETRLKRIRVEFEQEIERKKLEFEQYMQKERELFKQEIERKKLIFQLEKERKKKDKVFEFCLTAIPIACIAGIFLILILALCL